MTRGGDLHRREYGKSRFMCCLGRGFRRTHAHPFVSKRIQTYPYASIDIHTHPFASIRIHTRIDSHLNTSICVRTRSYAFICIHMHSYAFIRIHTHSCAFMRTFIRFRTLSHVLTRVHTQEIVCDLLEVRKFKLSCAEATPKVEGFAASC